MDLLATLDAYEPRTASEAADVARARALVASGDPWSRTTPLHLTGSALVVHPPTARVLLRWHERMQRWLQVGGHVDPGDGGALAAARREAREETGLADLEPWPDPGRPDILHLAVVPVPAGRGEPAHEHADVRYVLATQRPDEAVPETPGAPVRWMSIGDAVAAAGVDNLRESLGRLAALFAGEPA